MTSTKPLTASQQYARFVLSAWNKREMTGLQAALNQPSAAPGNLPVVEGERMDLIRDLGRVLLIAERSGEAENANQNAALALVRHLATCE